MTAQQYPSPLTAVNLGSPHESHEISISDIIGAVIWGKVENFSSGGRSMTQEQFGLLGKLTQEQRDLQARYHDAKGPERQALGLKLEAVDRRIEALGDEFLGCNKPGRKLELEYSFLSQRQRQRRIEKEIPLGDQAARVTVVPSRSGFHRCLSGVQVG